LIAESYWVSVLTVKCLGVIGNLLIVEFLGGILSYPLFHWLSLHLGLSVCFLVSWLDCLFLLAIGSVCEAVIQSLHFLFFISKIQKICSFCIMAFSLLITLH
jgi:hypothetical protein